MLVLVLQHNKKSFNPLLWLRTSGGKNQNYSEAHSDLVGYTDFLSALFFQRQRFLAGGETPALVAGNLERTRSPFFVTAAGTDDEDCKAGPDV